MHRELQTERLLLRPIIRPDAPFLFELMNSRAWIENIGDRQVYSLALTEKYIEEQFEKQWQTRGYGSYMVVEKSARIPLGICGIIQRESLDFPDLGFAFATSFQGKGFAHEASMAVLENAFSVAGFERVCAICNQSNTPSRKLLIKLGFVPLEKLMNPIQSKGELLYSELSNIEFNRNKIRE